MLVIDVPILVEETRQGLCDDEEEEGGEGASLCNSGSERERTLINSDHLYYLTRRSWRLDLTADYL